MHSFQDSKLANELFGQPIENTITKKTYRYDKSTSYNNYRYSKSSTSAIVFKLLSTNETSIRKTDETNGNG